MIWFIYILMLLIAGFTLGPVGVGVLLLIPLGIYLLSLLDTSLP
jgi:uncharacterized membrane protein YfcA